jgi:hypothetical protein
MLIKHNAVQHMITTWRSRHLFLSGPFQGGRFFFVFSKGFFGEDDLFYYSDLDSFSTPQLFHTNFYNHAHRLRLEKPLCLELSRSSNGFFKPLLDPDGGFIIEMAVTRPFRK